MNESSFSKVTYKMIDFEDITVDVVRSVFLNPEAYLIAEVNDKLNRSFHSLDCDQLAFLPMNIW